MAEVLSRGSVFVLTGAGISLNSGIPTYRDAKGQWQRSAPIQHQDFLRFEATRQRYWARSMVGWPMMSQAIPNAAHRALAAIQQQGLLHTLVTQNVDRLHQRAGSHSVIDLHGRVDEVVCLGCGAITTRDDLQDRLLTDNPQFSDITAKALPDGDADVGDALVEQVVLPACAVCGGMLKPHVVFFGDNVPKARVQQCYDALADAKSILILGSSLQVYSGFRFCRRAAELGLPQCCINQGVTRADALFQYKSSLELTLALPHLARVLGAD